MPVDYIKLLQRYDDPVRWEYPVGFDYKKAVERFRRYADDLASLWNKPLKIETGVLIQDASFHSQIFVSKDNGESVTVRFSNFGDMSTFDSDGGVPDELRQTLISLFEKHGYVYVPQETLSQPYTGDNPGVTGIRDWWIRYFDWV